MRKPENISLLITVISIIQYDPQHECYFKTFRYSSIDFEYNNFADVCISSREFSLQLQLMDFICLIIYRSIPNFTYPVKP